jgi:hypothetical protein
VLWYVAVARRQRSCGYPVGGVPHCGADAANPPTLSQQLHVDPTPKVFISYSWDSPEHKQWVSRLAELLRANGVDAILDQWDLAPGDNLTEWAERNVQSSDAILTVLTAQYNQKVQSRSGGVGFESALISSSLAESPRRNFIPIVREREAVASMPLAFRARMYLDFSDDDRFEENLHELLRAVFRTASSERAERTISPAAGHGRVAGRAPRHGVFVSYAHTDEVWLERFTVMLQPAVDNADLSVWSDRRINAGANWRSEIEAALRQAKVALLLVSPHFLASQFITKQELPPLLDAAQHEGLTIIWAPVSSCFYTLTPIAKYQAAHNPAQPLDTLTPARRNRAILRICEQVLAVS